MSKRRSRVEVKRAIAQLIARTEPSRAFRLSSAQLAKFNFWKSSAQLSSPNWTCPFSSAQLSSPNWTCQLSSFYELKKWAKRVSSIGSFDDRFWRIYYRKMSLKTGYLWEQMNVWIILNKFRLCLKITSKAHFKTYLCFSVFLFLSLHCGNCMILITHWFYMKSIFGILEVQNLPF